MNEEKIIEKLLEHDDRLKWIEENVATKSDIGVIIGVLDEQTVILKRLDNKRLFDGARIHRLEGRVDGHDKEIRDIKKRAKFP